MLEVRDLSKTYSNGVHALKSVSLEIPNGMFGLLGPNGAGKSTLMRTIATLQDPDSGSISLNGLDVLANKPEARRTLGYLPQEFGVYPKVSAEAMLDHFAVLKGVVSRGERKARRRSAAAADQSVGRAQAQARHVFRRHAPALRHRAGADRQSETHHRRRADRRSRSGRTQPLPQSARRDRRERRRDPVHAHRRGRDRSVPAHGDHRARPGAAHRQAERDDARARRARLAPRDRDERSRSDTSPEHTVLSTRLSGGKTIVHVLADAKPDDGFETVSPDLEDVYFGELRRQSAKAA